MFEQRDIDVFIALEPRCDVKRARAFLNCIRLDWLALGVRDVGPPERVNLFPALSAIFLCNHLGQLRADRGWGYGQATGHFHELAGRRGIIGIDRQLRQGPGARGGPLTYRCGHSA